VDTSLIREFNFVGIVNYLQKPTTTFYGSTILKGYICVRCSVWLNSLIINNNNIYFPNYLDVVPVKKFSVLLQMSMTIQDVIRNEMSEVQGN